MLAIVLFALNACANPENSRYEVHEGAYGERVELIDEYEECMKKTADDMLKAAGCEQYLKASQALK